MSDKKLLNSVLKNATKSTNNEEEVLQSSSRKKTVSKPPSNKSATVKSGSRSQESKSKDVNAKKAEMFSDLLSKVQALGFHVRREKLKQGHGWRCMSGSCLFKGEKMLFIDSKMSLDEQLHFLSSWLSGNGMHSPDQTAQAA